MKKHNGFTIIEVMVAVAIIAILAGIAVPQYTDYITRSQLVEAHAGLGAFRVQMEQYYQDNRNYGVGACGAAVPTYKNFTHRCELQNGDQGYLARAVGTSGRVPGFTFSINHANVRSTETVPSADWGTAPQNCFIVRKGSC